MGGLAGGTAETATERRDGRIGRIGRITGLDPVLWTLRYGSLCSGFEMPFIPRGTLVVERRVQSPRVIPGRDVIKNRLRRLRPRPPVTAIDEFPFQCRKETFRHRIVP